MRESGKPVIREEPSVWEVKRAERMGGEESMYGMYTALYALYALCPMCSPSPHALHILHSPAIPTILCPLIVLVFLFSMCPTPFPQSSPPHDLMPSNVVSSIWARGRCSQGTLRPSSILLRCSLTLTRALPGMRPILQFVLPNPYNTRGF